MGNQIRTTSLIYDLAECERYGRQIAMQLAYGHWPQARETIERAMRELPQLLEPVDPMSIPIADMDLPVRIVNALEVELNCIFARDLVNLTLSDLMSVRHMGPTSIGHIRRALRKLGLELSPDVAIAAECEETRDCE